MNSIRKGGYSYLHPFGISKLDFAIALTLHPSFSTCNAGNQRDSAGYFISGIHKGMYQLNAFLANVARYRMNRLIRWTPPLQTKKKSKNKVQCAVMMRANEQKNTF